MKIANTSMTRRGFGLLLGALLEDTDKGLMDAEHPNRRRLKTAKARRSWDAAVQWMSKQANDQADRDDAKTDAALQDRMNKMGATK